MNLEHHREEVIRLLTSLDERQKTIFKHIERIDNHLEKLNGKVAIHEKELTIIKTWGGVALFAMPIIINLIMKAI
jgi:hypothetical protein